VTFTGRVLVPAMEFAMTRDGIRAVVSRLCRALPADVALVRVGVEAAGHYHRPLTTAGLLGFWPAADQRGMGDAVQLTRRAEGRVSAVGGHGSNVKAALTEELARPVALLLRVPGCGLYAIDRLLGEVPPQCSSCVQLQVSSVPT
jgi:hypothetical protein